MAVVHSPLQHLLQRQAGLYQRFVREGEGQQGQLHRDAAREYREQQAEPAVGQGQLRTRRGEEREDHQAAQHQGKARMDQEPPQDRQGQGVALALGVQPLPVESMAAAGQVAVYEGRLRRGHRHLQLHEPTLPEPAPAELLSTCLADPELLGAGLDLRCRGHHPQHAPRLHTLPGSQRLGPDHGQLLREDQGLPAGPALRAQSHQARAPQDAESTPVVSHRTDGDRTGTPRPGLQSLPAGHRPEPALRDGVQRTHRPDRGHGQGQLEEDDWQTEAHGCQRQEQGLPGSGLLRHRQHLPDAQRHGAGHCRL